MNKKVLRIASVVYLIFGSLLIINSFSSITGFIIINEIGKYTESTLGLVFIITGIILLSFTESGAYQERESRLRKIIGAEKYDIMPEKDKYNKAYRKHQEKEEKREQYEQSQLESLSHRHIIRTEHFERAIRNHNPELIQKAIDKIGTGKGKEEKLNTGGYSVRVNKGDRLIFEKGKGKKIILTDYVVDDEYSRRSR